MDQLPIGTALSPASVGSAAAGPRQTHEVHCSTLRQMWLTRMHPLKDINNGYIQGQSKQATKSLNTAIKALATQGWVSPPRVQGRITSSESARWGCR
jgi:hypothetical protein